MTVRNGGAATLALWRPATKACHFRGKAAFIDKDQVLGVKIVLALDPIRARGLHISAFLVSVQRNWRLGAVEQDPNAAINTANADNSAFLFGKPRTARRTYCAHLEAGSNNNGLCRQASTALV
jgi:hypothetical protein